MNFQQFVAWIIRFIIDRGGRQPSLYGKLWGAAIGMRDLFGDATFTDGAIWGFGSLANVS